MVGLQNRKSFPSLLSSYEEIINQLNVFCSLRLSFGGGENRAKQTMETETDKLINYAIGEGVIDDSAVDWTDSEKQKYFDVCNAYQPSND